MHHIFENAIHQKLIIHVKFNSKEKGIIERKCIPFDFGPSRWAKDKSDKYHFYNLDSPDGKHTLSILPEQVLTFTLTEEEFDPAEYVTWSPINWFLKRDWGAFS